MSIVCHDLSSSIVVGSPKRVRIAPCASTVQDYSESGSRVHVVRAICSLRSRVESRTEYRWWWRSEILLQSCQRFAKVSTSENGAKRRT